MFIIYTNEGAEKDNGEGKVQHFTESLLFRGELSDELEGGGPFC